MKPPDRARFLAKLEGDVRQIEGDVTRLYGLREVFGRLATAFEHNPVLSREWTPLHAFIFGGYTAQACLHIRRLMDQAPHCRSVSLANAVKRLVDNPDLITRQDYVGRWDRVKANLPAGLAPSIAALAQGAIADRVRAMASQEFDQFCVAGEDRIDAERLRDRLCGVRADCNRVLTYIDKRLAHYDRQEPHDPTWGDLENAIDAVGDLFKHVSLLVIGSAPDDLIPEWQGGAWDDLLTQPWVVPQQ